MQVERKLKKLPRGTQRKVGGGIYMQLALEPIRAVRELLGLTELRLGDGAPVILQQFRAVRT